jgi:integrase
MAITGWSSVAMAKRYQHLIDSIRRDVATQVGGLLRDAEDDVDAGPVAPQPDPE